MPKYHHRLESHRLFQVEVRGDTLIITPKGDPAGFADWNFQVEHAALLALMENEACRNVLVDFSGSNYFGGKILSALAEWARLIKTRNGRFAVCELSGDMHELFHIFQVDGQWEQFPTREEGMHILITETPLQKLRTNWRPVALVACAFLVSVPLVPWSEHDVEQENRREYETVAAIWADMQDLKAQNAPPVEWRKLQRRADRELSPLIPELNRRAGSKTRQARLAQQILYVSRDFILKRLLVNRNRLELSRPTGPDYELYWKLAEIHMMKAERLMAGLSGRDIKYPAPDYPNDTQPAPHSDFAPAIAESNRFPAGPHASRNEP